MGSASFQNGTWAATRSVALRGTADTFGRPTLVNMTMPMVAQVDCPMTYGDEALKDQCLGKSHCAWSEYSGCRDWSDEEFCQRQSVRYENCEKEVIYHGGSSPRTVHCRLINVWNHYTCYAPR